MSQELKPYIPTTWNNPQSIIAYFQSARKNLLNIIPPSSFTQKYTTFPSRLGDTHYISDPDMLREVLKTRARDFPKSRSNNLLLEPVVPDSIFIADDEHWLELHKMIIPVFNKSNVAGFETDVRKIVDEFLDTNPLPPRSCEDLTPFSQDLTFQVISQILLSDDKSPDLLEIRKMFEEFLDDIARIQLWDLLAVKYSFLPNFRSFFHRDLIKRFRTMGRKIVDDRLAQKPTQKPDFLELLITSYDLRTHPTEANINAVQDNLITFIVAGHETTAMSIIWGLYALSFHPDMQEKIGSEANLPLDEMVYTEAALKEIMRLYPAAPLLARKTRKPEQVGELEMKANEGIIIPIIAVHRHRDHWENPDQFIPERFIDFTPRPMTYIPFGAGPRVCIGASFAQMEGKIILSKLMERYKYLPNGHAPQAHQVLTLRSSTGIRMIIKER